MQRKRSQCAAACAFGVQCRAKRKPSPRRCCRTVESLIKHLPVPSFHTTYSFLRSSVLLAVISRSSVDTFSSRPSPRMHYNRWGLSGRCDAIRCARAYAPMPKRHLPPSLAYAVDGNLTRYSEQAWNVEAHDLMATTDCALKFGTPALAPELPPTRPKLHPKFVLTRW